NGYTYYATTEVINVTPSVYIKIIANDGNLYGPFGTPVYPNGTPVYPNGTPVYPNGFEINLTNLFFIPINAKSPYRYKIYVNNTQISSNQFISLRGLNADDNITVLITDYSGIKIMANTIVLSLTETQQIRKNKYML